MPASNELAQRARQALEQDILNRRHRVARLAASLEALSPLGVLARGYSLTFPGRRKNARSATATKSRPATSSIPDLASGTIASRVDRQSEVEKRRSWIFWRGQYRTMGEDTEPNV